MATKAAKKPVKKRAVRKPKVKAVAAPAAAPKPIIIPRHKWTNGGEYVLILKCTDKDRKSYQGFQWPESGPVTPENWSRKEDCESGGLFGWAWGFSFGEGKDPDYAGKWIVFRAHPDDVIPVECKVKAVPNPEAGRTPEVMFCGSYVDALKMILPGHIEWVKHASSGAATASGYSGAATASGYSGAATASGDSGAATASGYRGAATASGDRGAATASGDRGAATASGDRGAATASGDRGAATASGDSGAATASGYRGAATASGDRGAAVITGEYATIEVSPSGLAAVRASEFYWRVRAGAVLVQRSDAGHWIWTSETIAAKDGDMLHIKDGVVLSKS